MNYATGVVAFSDPTERLPSWGGGSLIDEGSPPFLRPCHGHPHGVVRARALPRGSKGHREVPLRSGRITMSNATREANSHDH